MPDPIRREDLLALTLIWLESEHDFLDQFAISVDLDVPALRRLEKRSDLVELRIQQVMRIVDRLAIGDPLGRTRFDGAE
jgi:hypothetical protein